MTGKPKKSGKTTKKSPKKETGAPTRYNDNFPLLAEGYARRGYSDAQIAKALEISLQTYYTYQKKYTVFLDAIKRGKEPIDNKVENALLQRALGYSYEEVHEEVSKNRKGQSFAKRKTVSKHVAPDVGAQIFWLKNRRPKLWKDKREVSAAITSDDIKEKRITDVTAAEWADIQRKLRDEMKQALLGMDKAADISDNEKGLTDDKTDKK